MTDFARGVSYNGGMEVIYIDSLFFLNAGVDYVLLLAAGRLCARELVRPRLVLAALFGGAYAAASVLLPGFFALWTVKLLAGALMVFIAFGAAGYPRAVLVFFAVAAAFGGAVWCALTLGGSPAPGEAYFVPVSMPALALSFALCYAALTLAFRHSGKRASQRLRRVSVTLAGRQADFTALEDTGNELTDPVSGGAVVVAEAEALSALFDTDTAALLRGDAAQSFTALADTAARRGRLRLLPCSGVTGAQGLLLCFRPDALTVDGRKHTRAVAVAPRALSPDGAYRGLV